MTLATTHCSERIAPAILAAWRDGALSTAEAARVAAHVPACAACRGELDACETLDAALRSHPAPEPDGRLWHAVRDGMATGRRMQPSGTSVRRLTGGLATLAAVVLLALGFAQILHSRSVYIPANPITRTPTPVWFDFSRVPATPVATPGPRATFVKSVVTAMNFDAVKKVPISPTSHFVVNSYVHVVATARNIPKGESHTVSIRWFLQDQYLDLLGVSHDTKKAIKEDKLIDFALLYPTPGLGMAKVYFDRPDSDKGDDPNDPSLAATIYFAVESPTPVPTLSKGTPSSGSPTPSPKALGGAPVARAEGGA